MKPSVNIFWFRRDLRLHDNAGLYHALRSGKPVVPVFIFDTNILGELEDKADRRVEFIHLALQEMQQELKKHGATLDVRYGEPSAIYGQLASEYAIEGVYSNHDYEPYAKERDTGIEKLLGQHGIGFQTFKDQVIQEKGEVLKDDGKPYTVFTPYSRRWKATLTPFHLTSYPTGKYFSNFFKQATRQIISLEKMGFEASGISFKIMESRNY